MIWTRFVSHRSRSFVWGTVALAAVLLLGPSAAIDRWTLLGEGTVQAELSPTLPKAKVIIGGHVFRVDVAELPADQQRGLGGRKALLPDEGMIFVYRERHQPGFWMHGMLIPIDMLWIDTDHVVYIVHRAPPPKPGTPDDQLEVYTPSSPANFVLEIAAGRAHELGIKEGDAVQFDFSGK
jgi:uncharacterized protein